MTVESSPHTNPERETEVILQEAKNYWQKQLTDFVSRLGNFKDLISFENLLLTKMFTDKINDRMRIKDTHTLLGKRYHEKKIGLRNFFIDLDVPILDTNSNGIINKKIRINLVLELFNPLHHFLDEDERDKEWDDALDVSKIVYFESLKDN